MKRAVDVTFPAKDVPLRRDVNLLGTMLGEVLLEHGGRPLFERVEEARAAARRWRDGDDSSAQALAQLVGGMTPDFGQ
ncbi:MAG: phosphoenolpyruvate carboxylase, partial [Myxococcota bacterium]